MWRRAGCFRLGAAALLLAAVLAAWTTPGRADPAVIRDLPPGLQVPEDARPRPGFDVERATQAWLALLSPEQRLLSDAYFEGGYWLKLWNLAYALGALALLLWTGASRRMRDVAERLARHRPLQVALYATLFLVAWFMLCLPFELYAGFWREHAYGLSNLTLAGWLKEALIGLVLQLAFGVPAAVALYAAIKRTGTRSWLWATGLVFVLTFVIELITPVFIAPLFNDYRPLAAGPVRDAVFALMRANDVPTDHVAWFDNSKQTTRISANVSGLLGVTRVSLNDNLLERTSLPEIRAVLGHELGHYVLNHGYTLTVYLTLLFAVALWAVRVAADRALARWGPRLGLRDRADPAAFPLLFALFILVQFVLSPIANTIIRTAEAEADAFGLNAAREPEGFAMATVRLSTYRKLRPGPIEEFVFYDHPSGYERVRRAMAWRKENPLADR